MALTCAVMTRAHALAILLAAGILATVAAQPAEPKVVEVEKLADTLFILKGGGGNTAVFSMLNALLIKPLPFGKPQQLVRITEFFPKALLVHFRQQCRTMDIASASPGLELNVTGQGPAFRITVSPVSANLFAVLQTPARIGRPFDHKHSALVWLHGELKVRFARESFGR